MTDAERHVSCELGFRVQAGTALALQVAPTIVTTEDLDVRGDEVEVHELAGEHAGRIHVVRAGEGLLDITYSATVPPAAGDDAVRELDTEAVTYLRQSRYCPSDAMIGFANAELGVDSDAGAVAEWVFGRVAYELGLSTPATTALDTLAANAGACRDFAHLTIALCRARGIPARLVAVYAPGLTPMDFHAVVEARVDGRWRVLDPTRLAPRASLARIATGRDAADTAFATTLAGDAELLTMAVTAVVDGDLPTDDHSSPVALA